VAADLLVKKEREGKASATIGKRRWLHEMANADLGNRPIAEITAGDVLAVLRKVEATGHLETARRLKAAVSEVFRHAVPHLVAVDPVAALKGKLAAPVVKHRAAIIKPLQFGGLLLAIYDLQGQATTVAALKLVALTFVRPGELRLAQWPEIDLRAAVWTVPWVRLKMRSKRRIDHTVPLSAQAITIIEGLKPLAGASPFVFPHVSDPRRPMSENTLNAALRRMGFGPEEMISHGFRATASTLLNESGKWNPDAIEKALGHQDSDEVRGIYNRGKYWDERVRMVAWWADYLDTLRTGATVIPFTPHQAKG
jgi:integrase